jgi:hypothetical protein
MRSSSQSYTLAAHCVEPKHGGISEFGGIDGHGSKLGMAFLSH